MQIIQTYLSFYNIEVETMKNTATKHNLYLESIALGKEDMIDSDPR